MHLENHLVDGDFQVALDFQRGQQQIVAVLREIIGSPAHLRIQVDDLVGHIAHVHDLVFPLPEVISLEIHGFPLIGKHHIDDEVPQILTVLIAHLFLKIPHVQAVQIGADVIDGTVLLLQGPLHEI